MIIEDKKMTQINIPSTDIAHFWGLKEHSFLQKPDYRSKTFYLPESWILGLKRIMNMQAKGAQLSIISSHPAHNKSTLANWLHHHTPDYGQQMLLYSVYKDQNQPGWLLSKISRFFENNEGESLDELKITERVLTRLARLKQGLNIIIDDAHKLVHPKAFEEIYTLLSIQTHSDLHLNITLIGNQDLLNVLNLSKPLLYRVNTAMDTPPLTKKEMIELLKAGMTFHEIPEDTFSQDAIESIFNYTNGQIGRIKNLIDHCFYQSYLAQTKQIDMRSVQASMKYIRLPHNQKHKPINDDLMIESTNDIHTDLENSINRDPITRPTKHKIPLENLFLQDED